MTPPEILSDTARESLIDAAYQRLLIAKTNSEKYACWLLLCWHVRRRSAAQVQRMEREKGLRP